MKETVGGLLAGETYAVNDQLAILLIRRRKATQEKGERGVVVLDRITKPLSWQATIRK
jgi:hypothetical protein